jgi:hypothetical protein
MRPLKREHVREAVREGWAASITKRGHIRLVHPSGAVIFTGSTPSDHRVPVKLAADLRRALRKIERNPTSLNAVQPDRKGK